MRQVLFAVVTVAVKTAQWLYAKATGRPYDPGMDMPNPDDERPAMTDPTAPVPEPQREDDATPDVPVEQPQPHVQPAPGQPVEDPDAVPSEQPTVEPGQAVPGSAGAEEDNVEGGDLATGDGVQTEPEREG